jgi:hypothetical protein
MMNDILRDLLHEGVVCYLDDILIYSKNESDQISLVTKVLQRLDSIGLAAEIDKCMFHAQKVEFLGYEVSGDGLQMTSSRSNAIQNWRAPQNIHDVQVFLGFCNFYRRFIKNYAGITKPITDTLKKKGKDFSWGPEQESAFLKLKILFHTDNTPIMRHFNPEWPAILETDASDFAISGVLSQLHEKRLHPVAFMSKNYPQLR